MTQFDRPAGADKTSPVTRLVVFGLGLTAVGATVNGQNIRFSSPVVYDEVGEVLDLASGDLNGDGDIDLALASIGVLHIYSNDGRGNLTSDATIPYGVGISWLAAGQMNDDDALDLVWIERPSGQDNQLVVWYNSGDGRTGEVVRLPVQIEAGWLKPRPLLCDLNGDGLDDVVALRESNLVALTNNGDRTFTERTIFDQNDQNYSIKSLVAGDIDADGDIDIGLIAQYIEYHYDKRIIDTRVLLLRNDGVDRPFPIEAETAIDFSSEDTAAYDMAIGDFDGDGDLDFVVSGAPIDPDGQFNRIVFLERTGRTLTETWNHYASSGSDIQLNVSDVNANGRLDLLMTTSAVNGIHVIQNDGNFIFSGLSPFPSAITDSRFNVADLNGDGLPDLIDAGTGGFAVLFNESRVDGPQLLAGPLQRGEDATIAVRMAAPGERVYVAYSREAPGNSVGQSLLGGITLDLQEPIGLVGSAVADANGQALIRLTVPVRAPLGPVVLQGVIRRGDLGDASVKTPFQVAVITD